jgi:hypothetical protein
VLDAAVAALVRWVETGAAPPNSPEFAVDAYGQLVRDDFGNAIGGVRSPVLDVPVASYEGTQCSAAGFTIPFDDDTVRQLYPTHDDYVDRFRRSANAAVALGYLLPSGSAELVARACAAGVRWGAVASSCSPSVSIGTPVPADAASSPLDVTPGTTGPVSLPATGGAGPIVLAAFFLGLGLGVRALVGVGQTGPPGR